MQITPSILETKASDYVVQIKRLFPFYKHFQIDIADGLLVPHTTATLNAVLADISTNIQASVVELLMFDFHLMVKYPEDFLISFNKQFIKLNIDTIYIHFQALSGKKYAYYANMFNNLGKCALVINPEDNLQLIHNYESIHNIPIIQIMTVHPGKQGGPFLPEVIEKIAFLKSVGYRGKISVDGAVNPDTMRIMVEKKLVPDIACPGSYLTKADDSELAERVKKMDSFILT